MRGTAPVDVADKENTMSKPIDFKAVVGEMIGAFLFVAIGAGTICMVAEADPPSGQTVGLIAIALAHGFALANVINIFGPISGGHINPAVTFAVWLTRRIGTSTAALYIVAQLAGASLAGVLVMLIFPSSSAHLGALAVDTARVTPAIAVLIEAALTFFLVLSVFGTAVSGRSPNVSVIGGYGIGLTLMVSILMVGPLTGAALNPARAFGPALVAGFWDYHWIHWLGPLLGGAIAGLIYRCLYLDRPTAETAVDESA
jgi:MIP family channel proteins